MVLSAIIIIQCRAFRLWRSRLSSNCGLRRNGSFLLGISPSVRRWRYPLYSLVVWPCSVFLQASQLLSDVLILYSLYLLVVRFQFATTNNVLTTEEIPRRRPQPMHQAELLISDADLKRGAETFLLSYATECQNKTSKTVDTGRVLCSCVPNGIGEILFATNNLTVSCI